MLQRSTARSASNLPRQIVSVSPRTASIPSSRLPRQCQRFPHASPISHSLKTVKPSTRQFHATSSSRIDILPTTPSDASKAKDPEPDAKPTEPSPLSPEEYTQHSDAFFQDLLNRLEAIQEEKGDWDVEYNQGVLNLLTPGKGTYVLNKQPPNKQIWLSSPLSGPKRYDWVVMGDSMQQKEGGGHGGEWVYLRDGSTLRSLLKLELGVEVAAGAEHPAD
ncbi:MAG: Mitochondrial chaperone Frataxin [Chrysothrix sp. TS-e1954]|nr:MAG: Mitochondrial chaperone Frataxin [Chrysothrix sp. TS-e1954]